MYKNTSQWESQKTFYAYKILIENLIVNFFKTWKTVSCRHNLFYSSFYLNYYFEVFMKFLMSNRYLLPNNVFYLILFFSRLKRKKGSFFQSLSTLQKSSAKVCFSSCKSLFFKSEFFLKVLFFLFFRCLWNESKWMISQLVLETITC